MLPDSSGLQLSSRIQNRNGILVVDYNDKFVPPILAWQDPNDRTKYKIELDLNDAIHSTSISVYPDGVIVKGERMCTIVPQENIKMNTKKCGKYVLATQPPDDWYFEKVKVDLDAQGLPDSNIVCENGTCLVTLDIYTRGMDF